jgi:hypothetical protein
VGGGTVTPAGAIPWSAELLDSGTLQVTINSNSTNCPPSSAGIDVQTTYRFLDAHNGRSDRFEVERVFDFTAAPFVHDFRPYIPRRLLGAGYTEVLYPTPAGTLATMSAYNCPFGCTGPRSAPGAASLSPLWDSGQGWFAIHNPATLEGVVVSRFPSTGPQGNEIAPQLWIDNDTGPPGTNPSSFLLIAPTAGFEGGLVTEVETLCFYNSAAWTPSPVPPLGCRSTLANPVVLSPWTLTFAGQSVGATGAPQTAALRNAGAEALGILKVVSDGDFAQTNDCPASLPGGTACTIAVSFTPSAAGIRSGSVSILEARETSPQILSLAGLGTPAP